MCQPSSVIKTIMIGGILQWFFKFFFFTNITFGFVSTITSKDTAVLCSVTSFNTVCPFYKEFSSVQPITSNTLGSAYKFSYNKKYTYNKFGNKVFS